MKIDIAESLIRSWLRHVCKCTIVETNWKAPSWREPDQEKSAKWEKLFDSLKDGSMLDTDEDLSQANGNTFEQFISKAEMDVLGLQISADKSISLTAVDVAFHRGGLGYNKNGSSNNIQRVAKKMLRSAAIADMYFDKVPAKIIFATPRVRDDEASKIITAVQSVQDHLQESKVEGITLECIFNYDFESKILKPTIAKADEVADTSELFLRAVSLGAIHSRKHHDSSTPSNQYDNKPSDASNQKQTVINNGIGLNPWVKQHLVKISDIATRDMNFLNEITNTHWCNKHLGINFAFAKPSASVTGKNEHDRYWIDEFNINGEYYRFCSQWSCSRNGPRRRALFDAFLLSHNIAP